MNSAFETKDSDLKNEVKGMTKANTDELKGQLKKFVDSHSIGSYSEQLLDSCKTQNQRKKMLKFITKNGDKPLSILSTDAFHKLMTQQPDAFLDVINLSRLDWKKELAKKLGDSAAKSVYGDIEECWKEAATNNDYETLSAIEDMVKSEMDAIDRRTALQKAYDNRKKLVEANKEDSSESESKLNSLIDAWVSEE